MFGRYASLTSLRCYDDPMAHDESFIAATGFGKSLVYQITIMMIKEKFGLVVTPINALGEDQVKACRSEDKQSRLYLPVLHIVSTPCPSLTVAPRPMRPPLDGFPLIWTHRPILPKSANKQPDNVRNILTFMISENWIQRIMTC